MREDLEAVLERLQTTKSIEELQVWAHELRDALGVTHVVYHTVKLKGEQVGAFTYSLDWVRRYIEQDYSSVDPVVSAAVRRFHPIDWKTLDWSNPAARSVLREAIAARASAIKAGRCRSGGPNGEFAMFSVNHHASDDEWDEVHQAPTRRIFCLIAHLVHQQAMRIMNKEVARADEGSFAARTRGADASWAWGMSRAEVADSLGISENTLRAYIDSARHKLGAMNVTHAVALAVARGMIAAERGVAEILEQRTVGLY